MTQTRTPLNFYLLEYHRCSVLSEKKCEEVEETWGMEIRTYVCHLCNVIIQSTSDNRFAFLVLKHIQSKRHQKNIMKYGVEECDKMIVDKLKKISPWLRWSE